MSRLFRGREALRRIIDGVRTAPASARSGGCLVGSVGIGVKVRAGGGRDEPYQQAI
jgi:hypothetical protein